MDTRKMANTAWADRDRRRQVAVVISEVLCVIGTLVGVGVIGGPEVQQAAGGALAADATYIAPAAPAFQIWSVIYLGLFVYTVWQFLPGQTTNPRHRAMGWLAAASMILNALWLLVVRAGWISLSVVVIIALVVVLGLLIRTLHRHPATSTIEAVISDGTFGLYLGWVSVAVLANIAASLVQSGYDPGLPGVAVITSLVLVAATGLGVIYALAFGGRIAVAAAMAWGLAWIAYGRWTGEPVSALVTLVAIVCAVAVIVAALHVQSRSERGLFRARVASQPTPGGAKK